MLDNELLSQFPKAKIYDVSQHYSSFIPFTLNSVYPIHRWYRFKEGFSKDLVQLILGTMGSNVKSCLDPFAGSGTTPLACQEVGIDCYSIEVNPFLYHLSKTKLVTSYSTHGFDEALGLVRESISFNKEKIFEEPIMSTITQKQNTDKCLSL